MKTQSQDLTTDTPVALYQQEGTTLLGKIGWGMLGAALTLWGLTTVLLVYVGAPPHVGWVLLAVFVALIAGGLVLLAMSRPLERFLFQRAMSSKGLTPSLAGGVWEESWEQVTQTAAR